MPMKRDTRQKMMLFGAGAIGALAYASGSQVEPLEHHEVDSYASTLHHVDIFNDASRCAGQSPCPPMSVAADMPAVHKLIHKHINRHHNVDGVAEHQRYNMGDTIFKRMTHIGERGQRYEDYHQYYTGCPAHPEGVTITGASVVNKFSRDTPHSAQNLHHSIGIVVSDLERELGSNSPVLTQEEAVERYLGGRPSVSQEAAGELVVFVQAGHKATYAYETPVMHPTDVKQTGTAYISARTGEQLEFQGSVFEYSTGRALLGGSPTSGSGSGGRQIPRGADYSNASVILTNGAQGNTVVSSEEIENVPKWKQAFKMMSAVYDFYKDVMGRDGIDGDGMKLVASLENNFDNAYWSGDENTMTFGGGYSSQDVGGHEVTHGVIQTSARFAYSGEAGALNEGFADIFGVTIRAWDNSGRQGVPVTPVQDQNLRDPNVPKWDLMASTLAGGDQKVIRNMQSQQVPHGSGNFYVDYMGRTLTRQDSGGVHMNSGILNAVYVLMVDGGKHPRPQTAAQRECTVEGIGLDKAVMIAYRAMAGGAGRGLMGSTRAGFQQARAGMALAAAELYGAGSKEWQTVHYAFDSVRVPRSGTGDEPGTACGGSMYTASVVEEQ